MEASDSLSNIPNHIIPLILLQLPVKSVIRCQCVCKQWRSLIQDSDFNLSYRGQPRAIMLLHESKIRDYYTNNSRVYVRSIGHDLRLQRHKWPFGEAYALCSCNGIVLLVAERDILLWNPSTRCSTKVLERPYPKESKPVILAGLCYDSCTRDYKAVLLLYIPDFDYGGFGHPFAISASLNHKEWRLVEFPYPPYIRSGIDFRNTFHWWVCDNKDRDWNWNFLSGNRIIYFDPVHDKFRVLPTPELWHGKENLIVGLGVIDNCFCMACIVQEEEELQIKTIQVLIMKEYGRQETWMTAFAIQIMPQLTDTYRRYGFTLKFYSQKKNAQEVLFLLKCQKWVHAYVYDRKKDQLKEVLKDFLASRYICNMCFYVESLACPGHNGL